VKSAGLGAEGQEEEHLVFGARRYADEVAAVLRLNPEVCDLGFDRYPPIRKYEAPRVAGTNAQRYQPELLPGIVQHAAGFHAHQRQLDGATRRPNQGDQQTYDARHERHNGNSPTRAHVAPRERREPANAGAPIERNRSGWRQLAPRCGPAAYSSE